MKRSSHPEKKDKDVFFKAREDMVKEQITSRGIKDPQVLKAIKKVPRELFVPAEYTGSAYEDRPLPIGMGQTISQPYIVGLMTQALDVQPSDKVLEIGSGSGYQAAILSKLVKTVHTIEIKKVLYEKASKTLSSLGHQNVRPHFGDGYFGRPEAAPTDFLD